MTAASEIPPKLKTVDTKTRFQGVWARHAVSCAKTLDRDRRCTCRPRYFGKVWDRSINRHRYTERRSNITEAKGLHDDLLARVRSGTAVARPKGTPFVAAQEQFIEDCRDGVALNKHGEPYKPKAITNLNSSLNRLPESMRRRLFGSVTTDEFQNAVDQYRRESLSDSRINNIISSASSLFAWGKRRGMVTADPTGDVQTPVVAITGRKRIAQPREFTKLLSPLETRDALPFAIAAYATARLQEIQVLEWPDVDFEKKTILLADSEEARKSKAAWRIVPIVDPLLVLLEAEWIRQGKPVGGKVCPPRRESKSGQISLNQLSKRVAETWVKLGFEPIGLQDCRHTAATWLDHAGVSPKVVSVLMGHKAPSRHLHPGAAPITQRRYTHVLEGEIERAGVRLQAYLDEREGEEREAEERAEGEGKEALQPA